MKQGWSGSQVGDFQVGVKFNLLSEADLRPAAVAIRGMVKLPTGDKESGVGTGKPDGFIDFIVSKEAGAIVELSGYAEEHSAGSRTTRPQSNGFRYGIGAGFPARSLIRVTAEFNGEKPFDDTVTLSTPLVASTAACPRSRRLWVHSTRRRSASRGRTGRASSSARPPPGRSRRRSGRTTVTDDNRAGDFVDYQIPHRLPPGRAQVRRAAATAATAATAGATAAESAADRRGALRALHGRSGQDGSTVTAVAQDPDGDTLTYRWSAAVGTLAEPGRPTDALDRSAAGRPRAGHRHA